MFSQSILDPEYFAVLRSLSTRVGRLNWLWHHSDYSWLCVWPSIMFYNCSYSIIVMWYENQLHWYKYIQTAADLQNKSNCANIQFLLLPGPLQIVEDTIYVLQYHVWLYVISACLYMLLTYQTGYHIITMIIKLVHYTVMKVAKFHPFCPHMVRQLPCSNLL